MKYLILFFVWLVGLCVGSFLNVVIYRLPLKMSLAKPDSHCPKCKTPIKWYDNIPILSYIVLRGKCRVCKTHIPIRYTLVEAANSVLWLACGIFFYDKPIYAALLCIVMSCLICIFFIDLENMIIPDSFNLIILACALISIFSYDAVKWYEHLIGLAVGGGFFLISYYLGCAVFHKEALGGGDIKFMAVAGALMGWKCTLLTVLLSSVTASVVLLLLSAKNKEAGSKPFPFGPFLAVATAFSLLFGNDIIAAYISFITGGF